MNSQCARLLSLQLKRDSVYFTTIIRQRIRTHSLSVSKSRVNPISSSENILRYSSYPPKCWQCDFPQKSDLFCSKCKALQKPPKDLNYFDIIGVKQDFDISVEDVQKKYRKLQTLLHPDRFGQKTEKEQDLSESLSSLVNKAYSTLMHPLDRGLYMLKLHNVTIPEGTTSLEPEFLMEIMELNEEIEEASENKKKVLELLVKNRSTLTLLTRKISDAFHHQDIEQAKKYLIRMKYYISIEARLKQLKQNLGIVE
ncbi:iron-sulfur cluster co-chaperone protein HscB [Phymastichus coffea]|uniref:iron-sulfur cluster co-chaperone protein HscB n=1 Tax=Phymastichus coffea TaxID=108790 RepID=UPI00273B2CA3|nr:iron-sulfur cluster co-chaperone protein HscB [Phymastichus coffea]